MMMMTESEGMSPVHTSTWTDLLIERRTSPPALDETSYHTWLAGRRVFVSSVMDDEMLPARTAVAAYLKERGGDPVMWEEITPRDRRPQEAYLEGVEQSAVFALLVGSRYGRSDSSGYSPTHREANRAQQLDLPRLLFERDGVPVSERDGRLNDWVGSLYSEVSGARYADPRDLVRKLDKQLRELASAQDTYWVKLGPLVFPGMVVRRSSRSATEFTVRATLRDPAVRRAVAGLGQLSSRASADRLTWALETHPVQVTTVESRSVATSTDDVVITCTLSQDRGQSATAMLGGIRIGGPGRSIGPTEQAEIWARRALFGERPETSGRRGAGDSLDFVTAPDGPALPEVLATHGAQGWLAEGLTRLYAIEGLAAKFGGHYERLEVGPATAAAIRVDARFRTNDHDGTVAKLQGRVPVPSSR